MLYDKFLTNFHDFSSLFYLQIVVKRPRCMIASFMKSIFGA